MCFEWKLLGIQYFELLYGFVSNQVCISHTIWLYFRLKRLCKERSTFHFFFFLEMLCIWTCSRGPVCLQVGLIMKLVYSQGSNVQMLKSPISNGTNFDEIKLWQKHTAQNHHQVDLISNLQVFVRKWRCISQDDDIFDWIGLVWMWFCISLQSFPYFWLD